MFTILQTIFNYIVDLSTLPEIKQKRHITCEFVEKEINPTRDAEGYPITGLDVVP